MILSGKHKCMKFSMDKRWPFWQRDVRHSGQLAASSSGSCNANLSLHSFNLYYDCLRFRASPGISFVFFAMPKVERSFLKYTFSYHSLELINPVFSSVLHAFCLMLRAYCYSQSLHSMWKKRRNDAS